MDKLNSISFETERLLEEVESPGFLNNHLQRDFIKVRPNHFVFVVASDGHQIYRPEFMGDIITLRPLGKA